jgi:RNA polymerase sigma factor (sigma-70 family)
MSPEIAAKSDAELVEWSRSGDRSAFAAIVKRYQRLVCSITYNATGSLSLSEDLAQETFFAAWKQMAELREPERLRAWLCGIARFLVGKEFRKMGREPAHAAEALDAIEEPQSAEASPAMQAVSREEEAILWRALERIPDTYREPLILFYREEKSIERVAAELELSEDAVKQRLSRGRKLLHEEVVAFVEGTLSRTAPGQNFSNAVLAMLPAASAATVGAGVAGKGAAMAKSGAMGGWAAAWLGPLTPFVGVFAGLMVNWISVRSAPTARERRFQGLWLTCFWIFVLGWCLGGQYAVRALRHEYGWSDAKYFAVVVGFWWFYAMVVAGFLVLFLRRAASMRRQIALEPGKPESSGAPLTAASRIAIVAGIYVAMFSAMIYLAFSAHDWLAGAILLGAMIVLGGWQLHYMRSRDGAAAWRAMTRRLVLAWAVILVMLNWRLGGWVAAARGVDVAVMHGLLPAWAIPVATLTLLVWIGALVAWTRPGRGADAERLGLERRLSAGAVGQELRGPEALATSGLERLRKK